MLRKDDFDGPRTRAGRRNWPRRIGDVIVVMFTFILVVSIVLLWLAGLWWFIGWAFGVGS